MSLAAFTQLDENGKEFLGLVIQEGYAEIKVYLGHADNIKANLENLVRVLGEAADEMIAGTENKKRILAVEGSLKNGFRTTQGRK